LSTCQSIAKVTFRTSTAIETRHGCHKIRAIGQWGAWINRIACIKVFFAERTIICRRAKTRLKLKAKLHQKLSKVFFDETCQRKLFNIIEASLTVMLISSFMATLDMKKQNLIQTYQRINERAQTI